MILTNEKILESIPVLTQAKDEKGLLGYAIAVNLRKLNAEVQEFSKKRNELLEQYGTDTGDGRFTFTAEAAAEFQNALRPFAELENDVPVLQVPLEVFYGGNLTSAQMYVLDWMVKEG